MNLEDFTYNQPMSAGRLKELLKDIPDDVAINVTNNNGKNTSNIEFWYENLQTRQFILLTGHKPFYEMTEEEKKKCGFE